MSPFESYIVQNQKLTQELDRLEQIAREELRIAQWSFAPLKDHLKLLSILIGLHLPLRAWKEHQRFSVTPKGRLLGAIASEQKTIAARKNGAKGGRAKSKAKTEAARRNAKLPRHRLRGSGKKRSGIS